MDGILTALRGHRVQHAGTGTTGTTTRTLQTDSNAAIEEKVDNDQLETPEEIISKDILSKDLISKDIISKDILPKEQPERFSAVVTNTNNNNKNEDYLVNQIDEFREKALQLQNLLSTKESRVQELQVLVDEREGKAEELQQILTERQGQMNQMNNQMTQMSNQMGQMGQASQLSQEQLQEISASLSAQMDGMITKISSKIDELADGMGEEWENSERITDMKFRQLGTSIDQLKGSIDPIMGSFEPLKTTIESSAAQMSGIEENLSEKIHNENVKVFRNVQDLFTELDEKVDMLSDLEEHITNVKKLSTIAIVFSVLDFVAILAMIAGFLFFNVIH